MSAKIALQVLGSVASAGTVTTGLVFGAPKLKSAFHSGVFDDASSKSLNEISDVETVSKSIETKPTPP